MLYEVITDEDRQVYYQIARQTSVILQNISLLNETRRRLKEVDLLLDFSRQISGLPPGEIVKALLDSALRVIQPAAHAGVVLLWDETTTNVITSYSIHYTKLYDSLQTSSDHFLVYGSNRK